MKISEMLAAAGLNGSEVVPIVRGSENFKLPITLLFTSGEQGDSAYQIAVTNGFVGTEVEWVQSLQGMSAFEIAQQQGFVGTEAEWLLSLKGTDGKSAYELAVEGGFVGTQAAWIASLKGNKGDAGDPGQSAYELALAGGFSGTFSQWLTSLRGVDGKSAYELAVAGGFIGTESEWLLSLVGQDGKSAYASAVEGGFVGTQAEWVASLQGADGSSAYQVAVAEGFVGTEAEWLASLAIPPNEKFAEMNSVTVTYNATSGEYETNIVGASYLGQFATISSTEPGLAGSTFTIRIDPPIAEMKLGNEIHFFNNTNAYALVSAGLYGQVIYSDDRPDVKLSPKGTLTAKLIAIASPTNYTWLVFGRLVEF